MLVIKVCRLKREIWERGNGNTSKKKSCSMNVLLSLSYEVCSRVCSVQADDDICVKTKTSEEMSLDEMHIHREKMCLDATMA